MVIIIYNQKRYRLVKTHLLLTGTVRSTRNLLSFNPQLTLSLPIVVLTKFKRLFANKPLHVRLTDVPPDYLTDNLRRNNCVVLQQLTEAGIRVQLPARIAVLAWAKFVTNTHSLRYLGRTLRGRDCPKLHKIVSLNGAYAKHRHILVVKLLQKPECWASHHFVQVPALIAEMNTWSKAELKTHYVDLIQNKKLEFTYIGSERKTFEDAIRLYRTGSIALVTETLFYCNMPYFSEKVLQAMYAGVPFILASTPHSLALLRKAGFRTFGKWWDESYDRELNHTKRLDAILRLVDQLLSLDDLDELIRDMRPVIEYNAQHFPLALKTKWTHSQNLSF